jgi:hypothetical protein
LKEKNLGLDEDFITALYADEKRASQLSLMVILVTDSNMLVSLNSLSMNLPRDSKPQKGLKIIRP